MAAALFVIESIRQEVTASELLTEIVLADGIASAELDLQLSDERLHLSHADATKAIVFALPICSASASSRLSKVRRALVIRSALSWTALRHVRVTVGALGRGEARVMLPVPWDVPDGMLCYVLVSRSGEFASREAGGYTWCYSYSALASDCLSIAIDCCSWVWECHDACITWGTLGDGEASPAIQEGCEQVGVRFSFESTSRQVASARGATPLVSTDWIPEEARLPSPSLRMCCRMYDDAFSRIDGHELSGEYTRHRPPPPTWNCTSAPEGKVIDSSYSSLTYGEAEFVPLCELLSHVGLPGAHTSMPTLATPVCTEQHRQHLPQRDRSTHGCAAGSLMVDLGSGTGRMVLCAALAFPDLRGVRGIELVPQLHAGAVTAHRHVSAAAAARNMPCAPVELLCADMLEATWSDADLVLSTSLCFSPTLVALLHRRARELRPGARFLCMQSSFDEEEDEEQEAEAEKEGSAARTRAAAPAAFRCVPLRAEPLPTHGCEMQMSFGSAQFYLYERVED